MAFIRGSRQTPLHRYMRIAAVACFVIGAIYAVYVGITA